MSSDVAASQDEAGWTFRFRDPVVIQLQVDFRFSLLLGGGALVVLETPFELRRGARSVRVPPGDEVFEVSEALFLFGSQVEAVRASSSGQLRIDFGGDVVVHVPVDPNYENWQLVMPDGEQWVGTPGGGIAHFA
jgi:hypothetical protein